MPDVQFIHPLDRCNWSHIEFSQAMTGIYDQTQALRKSGRLFKPYKFIFCRFASSCVGIFAGMQLNDWGTNVMRCLNLI